jgi:hypothetical protein
MITSFEEMLYNEYLKASRSSKNKPYKLRKDFSDISPEVIVTLKRISRLLLKLTNIKPVDFFKAPFALYPEDYFDLKFFTTQKALKMYTTFMKTLESSDPDSLQLLEQTRDSLLYIQRFLRDENISLDEYCHHKTNLLPTFLLHLKERSINFYALFALPNVERVLKDQDKDVIKFMFDESFFDKYSTYFTRFLQSKKCKLLVNYVLKSIQIKTNKKLEATIITT